VGSEFGVVKAGKTTMTSAAAAAGKVDAKAVMPAPVEFWVAREKEGKALRTFYVMPANDSGAILGGLNLPGTLKAILDVTDGERMQFSMRYRDEPLETVVTISQKMPTNERVALIACLDAVADRMLSTAMPATPPPIGESD
jgi:hypothetical protein